MNDLIVLISTRSENYVYTGGQNVTLKERMRFLPGALMPDE